MHVPDPSYFDADPWLLGVRNGAVDLRTGKLLAPSPELRISKVCPVEYDGECDVSIVGGDLGRQSSRQCRLDRLCAAAWEATRSAETLARRFRFSVWHRRDLKSTFMNVLQALLGEYVGSLPSRVLHLATGNDTETGLLKLRPSASACYGLTKQRKAAFGMTRS